MRTVSKIIAILLALSIIGGLQHYNSAPAGTMEFHTLALIIRLILVIIFAYFGWRPIKTSDNKIEEGCNAYNYEDCKEDNDKNYLIVEKNNSEVPVNQIQNVDSPQKNEIKKSGIILLIVIILIIIYSSCFIGSLYISKYERNKSEKLQTNKLTEEIEEIEVYRAAVKLNGFWGFIDESGNVIIPFRYDYLFHGFKDGDYASVRRYNSSSWIDKNGQELTPVTTYYGKYKYSRTEYYSWQFSEGLAIVDTFQCDEYNAFLIEYKYGFINKSGNEVIPIKYDQVGEFSEGLASACINGKWGFIDKTGNEVIPFKYDTIHFNLIRKTFIPKFSNEFARVRLNKQWIYVNNTGVEIIPRKYDNIYDFSEDIAKVELNKKIGFIDKTGNEIIPCIYDIQSVSGFSDGFACVKANGKYGFIDKTGKTIISCKYDYAENFSEGLACVKIDEKYGYIDKTGKEVILCEYENAKSFFEGLASVKLNGKYGYIDKTGKIAIQYRYDDAQNFYKVK